MGAISFVNVTPFEASVDCRFAATGVRSPTTAATRNVMRSFGCMCTPSEKPELGGPADRRSACHADRHVFVGKQRAVTGNGTEQVGSRLPEGRSSLPLPVWGWLGNDVRR